jgi:hypothetical protein
LGGTPNSLSSENLEVLTQKVSTLGLLSLRKNSCGTVKKGVNARSAEAPPVDFGSGQPQAFRASQPQNLQKHGTSGAQRKTKERQNMIQFNWTEIIGEEGAPKGPRQTKKAV